MASKSKEARLDQRAYWQNQLDQRLAALTEQGVEPQKIAKDITVRSLRAKLRKTESRLKVIAGREQKVAEMATAKAEKQAAPKKDKVKAEKVDQETQEMSKRQQKKQKKKEGKQKE